MSKPNRSLGLAQLIAPYSVSDFFKKTWADEPLLLPPKTGSITALRDLPFLRSLDALLNSWPDLVQAHLPEVADEASSIEVTPKDAKKVFANQMGLLFNQLQKISPVLTAWLAAIQADLGLPAMTYSRCMAYATPDGKGTAPHFDQNINFVLQLTGTKKWWLAKNTHVISPSQRHTIGLPVDPELTGYLDTKLPTKMPAHQKAFVLKPGSVLFIPQGYWHKTEASGEALSLNFTYSQPSWVDLFTSALRSRLLLSPEWRALADGVSSRDPERRANAEEKLETLLAGLTYDLPNWNASDILNSTETF